MKIIFFLSLFLSASLCRAELVIGTTEQLSEPINHLLNGYQQAAKSSQKALLISNDDTGSDTDYRLMVVEDVPKAMARGLIQLGFMSRKWTDKEVASFVELYGVKPRQMLFAASATGLIVGNTNPVNSISKDDFDTITSAFQDCRLSNSGMGWSLLTKDESLKNMPMLYLVQSKGLISGDYHCDEAKIDTAGVTVRYFSNRQKLDEALEQHKNAIAIVPMQENADQQDSKEKYLTVMNKDGSEIKVSAANVISGTYPIASQYFGYANGTQIQLNAKPLVRYIITDDAQQKLKEHGMLPLPEEFRHRARVLIGDVQPVIAGGYR